MAQTIDPSELGIDNSNQPGQSNQNTNQAGVSPTSSPQGQSTSATNPNASNPNVQQGSGYTNIQKVIQANQGNQLGSAVGNNIQQVGNAAQDNLKNSQNQFQQQSAQNQFNTDQNNQTVQNVLSNPNQYYNQDPNSQNGQQGSQFSTLISGQYQGPQNLNNSQQLQQQAQNVQSMGQALGSSAGRMGLLQNTIGNPQYQAGAQNLDSLLLGQSNDPSLQAAKRQALSLTGQVNNAIAGAGAQAQQYTNQAQAYGKDVQNQLGQNVTAQDQALQNLATKSQTDRDAQYQKTLADLKSGNISQQEADSLGLTQGQNVYNLLNDPTKFVSEDPLKASAQNVASADDYARMQALQKLAGGFSPQAAQSIFQQYQDPTQAGKFQATPGIVGNKDDFGTQLASTQSNYNSISQPAQSRLAAAQDINNLVKQRDSFQQMTPEWYAVQAQIQAKYPGAVTNGYTQADWANSNLQGAQANNTQAQNILNQQFGTPETINIQSQYPNLADLGLEKIPTVS